MSKQEHAPYIYLSTALSIAGTELLELAGAINERCEASEFHLKRAAHAARKALAAIDDYHKVMDAAKLDPPRFVPGSKGPHPRPSYHRQAEGLRAEDVLPPETADDVHSRRMRVLIPLGRLDALNGDDPEAA